MINTLAQIFHLPERQLSDLYALLCSGQLGFRTLSVGVPAYVGPSNGDMQRIRALAQSGNPKARVELEAIRAHHAQRFERLVQTFARFPSTPYHWPTLLCGSVADSLVSLSFNLDHPERLVRALFTPDRSEYALRTGFVLPFRDMQQVALRLNSIDGLRPSVSLARTGVGDRQAAVRQYFAPLGARLANELATGLRRNVTGFSFVRRPHDRVLQVHTN
jgi:hypothetical protein